jgi:hypothetical protein
VTERHRSRPGEGAEEILLLPRQDVQQVLSMEMRTRRSLAPTSPRHAVRSSCRCGLPVHLDDRPSAPGSCITEPTPAGTEIPE